MGELSINGIYQRDDKVYSNQSEYKSDSAITIDFSSGIQSSNGTTPIYTLMGCGFTYEKSLKNPNQEFDTNGRLIKQNFGPRTVEYEYDKNGVKTKETETSLLRDDGSVYKRIILFDANGKEYKCYYMGIYPGTSNNISDEGTVRAEYDAEGHLLKRTITSKPPKVASTEYYDKNGYIRQLEYENSTEYYQYDETGLLQEVNYSEKIGRMYDVDKGKVVTRIPGAAITTKYKYNKQNQLISKEDTYKEINGKTNKYITKYEYNDKGFLSAVKYFKDGKLDSKVTINYDENDKIKSQKLFDETNKPYLIFEFKDGKFVREKWLE